MLTKYAFYSWANHAQEFYERKKAGLEQQNSYAEEIHGYQRFTYAYSDPATRFSEAMLDIVLLCMWNGVLFLAGYLTFLKCEVR